MKAKTIALLAGAGGSLLISRVAVAGFEGLSLDFFATDQTGWSSPVGSELVTIRVYADFGISSPGDHMIAVAGTPDNPMNIEAGGGTFYQTAVGNDQAPNSAFFGVFPSLEFDTFVSIGALTSAGDATSLSPGWTGFGPSSIGGTNIAWFITPDDAQGEPSGIFNRVLLGQFTVNAHNFTFEALIFYESNGETFMEFASISPMVPAPGVWVLLGLAGLGGRGRGRGRRTA